MNAYDLNDLIDAELERVDNYEWLFEGADETTVEGESSASELSSACSRLLTIKVSKTGDSQ